MHVIHPIVEISVREAANARRLKKISYEKLLPYAIKTLQFLITCAQNRRFTTYKEISETIGVGSPQNANWGFGTIYRIFDSLEKQTKFSGIRFPDITTIVRKTGRTTCGVGVFIHPHLEQRSKDEQDRWLTGERDRVFSFKRWDEVLSFLQIKSMQNLSPSKSETVLQAFERKSHLQSGKSPEHQTIQDWLQRNLPAAGIKLDGNIVFAQQEYLFWSLDRLDLLMKTVNEWVGIEVKPSSASDEELRKGLYQVIKYDALMNAELLAEGSPQSARCILVTGGLFPRSLDTMRKRFRIRVVDNLLKKMSKIGP